MEIKNDNKSIILGIIGAVIGAAVATIPWVLMYVYGEMILSLLAILIAVGALFGYQLFKGKVTKQLPIIISIISLVMVIFATLVVIPLLLLGRESLPMTLDNLTLLYEQDAFKEAIFKDLIFSIVFTVLGISGVISNIKKQLAEGKTAKITSGLRRNKTAKKNVQEDEVDDEEKEDNTKEDE